MQHRSQSQHRKSVSGFTLIEVILALGVVAMIAVVVLSLLGSIGGSARRLRAGEASMRNAAVTPDTVIPSTTTGPTGDPTVTPTP